MIYINKILKLYEKRILMSVIKYKFFHFIRNLFIKNNNVIFNNDTSYTYYKYKKKYKFLLKKEVEYNISKIESNKIWILWLQGEENAPELVKKCISSTRKIYFDKEVIILSEKNINEYVKLPDYITRKYKQGLISNAHYSDILRIELLYIYGGVWMDATVLSTKREEKIFYYDLFVFKNLDLTRKDINPIVASSWFIYSKYSNNSIIGLTRTLIKEYWKTNNYLENYFLFHIFFTLSTEVYSEAWNNIPNYNNHNPHILMFELNNNFDKERWEYIKYISNFHKLTHHNLKELYSNKYNFYNYIINEV